MAKRRRMISADHQIWLHSPGFRDDWLTSALPDGVRLTRPQTLGDNQLRAYIPRSHENPAWWCNGSTSDSGSLPPDSQSSNSLEVTATTPAGCSTGCSNSPENERSEAVGSAVSRKAGDSVVGGAESLPIKADSFSAALAMIASLPLSDAEKADAVRRLMAERVSGPIE